MCVEPGSSQGRGTAQSQLAVHSDRRCSCFPSRSLEAAAPSSCPQLARQQEGLQRQQQQLRHLAAQAGGPWPTEASGSPPRTAQHPSGRPPADLDQHKPSRPLVPRFACGQASLVQELCPSRLEAGFFDPLARLPPGFVPSQQGCAGPLSCHSPSAEGLKTRGNGGLHWRLGTWRCQTQPVPAVH